MAITVPTSSYAIGGTYDKPTGTQEGDLLIAGILADNDGAAPVTPPSGWTQITFEQYPTGGRTLKMITYYKIATASEPSTYVFTALAGVIDAGGILRVTGMAAITPVEASDTSGVNTGVTESIYDSLLIQFWASWNFVSVATTSNYAVTNDNPTWTEDFDFGQNFSGSYINFAAAHAIRTPTTATGAFSATVSVSPWQKIGAMLLIKRETLFYSTPTDTVTPTDDVLVLRGLGVYPTDTVNVTDLIDQDSLVKKKNWINDSKHSADWINDDKH